MRKGDISYTANGAARSGAIEYPDLWCFVFNPNYVVIKMDDNTANNELTVTFSTADGKSYEVFVNLYKGEAKVYISKVLQILIDDAEHHRTVVVRMSLSDNGTVVLGSDITFIAVWGGLQIGERFGTYGAFEFNGKNSSHVRDVVWFRKFPFYVSMFRADSEKELASLRYDNHDLTVDGRFFRCRIDTVETGELPNFGTPIIETLDNPEIILNQTHGIVYAKQTVGGTTKYYQGWRSSGHYGSYTDYNDIFGEISVRDDTEFEYQGEIVRWNSVTKQLENVTVGNAGDEGIFELNPAISFPQATFSAEYDIILENVSSAIFDIDFDFPFPDVSKIIYETVNLHICNDQDGIYLRWIDRFGFVQFYLFVEGESTVKSKASTNVIQVERMVNGLNFGGLERPIDVTNTETRKCCAVNLPKQILEYVKTIVNAPIVDLYLGKNKAGTELWLPVNVADGSYKTDPDTMLSDYEITIQLPENISQSL